MNKVIKGWKWEKVGNFMRNDIEALKKSTYPNDNFIYIDISSLDTFTKTVSNPKEIKVVNAPSRAKYILKEKDIVISNVRPNLNAVALIDKQLENSVGTSGFTVVRLKDEVDPNFFFYFFVSPFFIDYVGELVQGAMYPAISDKDIKNCPIPLPEKLEDQVVIAKDLQSRLAHVETMRQAALKQKEAAKALQSAILREEFAGSENLSSIPIKKTGKIITGYTPPRGELDNYGGQTPWIKPEDLDQTLFVSNSKEFISKSGLKKRRLLPINSILVSCIGNIGKMAIAGVPLVTNQQINSVIPNDDIDPLFLYFAIKFAIQNKKDINIALVSILNAGDFGKVAIPYIQGKEKQKLFAENVGAKLEKTEAVIKEIEKKMEAINALPAAILREAFNFEGSR